MLVKPLPRCDCCGSPVDPQRGADCPFCGYPINELKEEQFLQTSLKGLQRVATYGGASSTVAELIGRYQRRLQYLHNLKLAATAKLNAPVQPVPPIQKRAASEVKEPSVWPRDAKAPPIVTQPIIPPVSPIQRPPAPVTGASYASGTDLPPVQLQAPERMFSLKTFFADQTINIIASLGAFLILIGSISFIANTGNDLLSFLVIVLVHALFGIIGALSYRFKQFRTVAIIYTAIFALQVPLVGVASYQLISGNIIHLSAPTLVGLAALYAAIVYGALAVYQKFPLFGYLAVVALAVADLAVALSNHLNYWWWPSMLMVLALPALLSLTKASLPSQLFRAHGAVLREPVRFLMGAVIVVNILGIFVTAFSLLTAAFAGTKLFALPLEVRFALESMLLLLLCWVVLFVWRTGLNEWMRAVPYLFVANVLTICYAFQASQIGYILAFIGMAVFFVAIERLAMRLLQPFKGLARLLEILALLLVACLPFIVDGWLPWQLVGGAWLSAAGIAWQTTSVGLVGMIALILGCLLTIHSSLQHAGWSKTPEASKVGWCMLLLLGGVLAGWAYGLLLLITHVHSVWGWFGFTLVLIALSLVLRRFVSASWARPLEIVSLVCVALTILLSAAVKDATAERSMILLLFFAALFYGLVLFERRERWLFLPLVFVIWALPFVTNAWVFFGMGGFLPLVAAGLAFFVTRSWGRGGVAASARAYRPGHWVWPLLVSGLLYGVLLAWHDAYPGISTVQRGLGIAFPWSLELTVLAIIWYVAAVIAHIKWWQVFAVGFALAALLAPANPFWILAGVAFGLVLLAWGVSRLVELNWALSLYTVAICAAVMMGVNAPGQHLLFAAIWMLLLFAVLLYLMGIMERKLDQFVLIVFATCFACWSVYYAGLDGDLFYPPMMALACAAIGVGIGSLRFFMPALARPSDHSKLLLHRLALYATAVFAAILTGVYGTFRGINHPFAGAIPDILLIYALVAFGVLLFERRPQLLPLVAVFALWGTLLAIQTTAYYVAGVGLSTGVFGLLCAVVIKPALAAPLAQGQYQLTKSTWGWPWYTTTLMAAVLIGLWRLLPSVQPPMQMGFLEYSLFAFAILAYLIGMVEDRLSWSWIGALLAIWSLFDAARHGDVLRLFSAVLLCSLVGLFMLVFRRLAPRLAGRIFRRSRIEYSLPLYGVALVAAILTGIPFTTSWSVNTPFYAAIPGALLIYALLAYGLLWIERRPQLLWGVAGFALWSTLLLPQTTAAFLPARQAQTIQYSLAGMVLFSGLLGLCIGVLTRFVRAKGFVKAEGVARFGWSWPWYLNALLAVGVALIWGASAHAYLASDIKLTILCLFMAIALVIMLVERSPECLLLVVALAVWTIAQTEWSLQLQLIADTVLCLLIFSSQFIWRLVPPATRVLPAFSLHRNLGLIGLVLVVWVCMARGGLVAGSSLAQVGVGALGLLALFVFWSGRLQTVKFVERLCAYLAGFLLALVITWELLALHQTQISLLTLAPATYLIVLVPFLTRDAALPQRHQLGQLCSIMGAILLLLPTLWLSFGSDGWPQTLILAGEALALFLLGVVTRLRFFVLSGAALVIISAIHLLFLRSLGIPTFLALTLLGVLLLGLATLMMLVRSRIAVLWGELE